MNKRKLTGIISAIFILNITVLASVFAESVLVEADKQNYDIKNNSITLDKNVKVRYGNMLIKSQKAVVHSTVNGEPDTGVFSSNPLAISQQETTRSEVKANVLKLSLFDKKLKAEGNARSVMLENKTPIAIIRSKNQEFDLENNIITADGNVSILYNDSTAKASFAKINMDSAGKPELVYLNGAAQIVQGQTIINATHLVLNPQTSALAASGHAVSSTVLDDGTNVIVRSEYQQFDKASNTMISGGNVCINYKDYIANGPKATFLSDTASSKPNKIVFIGRSTIKQGERIVAANRITITMDPKNFVAEGNVKTRFSQMKTMETQPKGKKGSKHKRMQNVNSVKPISEESYLDSLDKQEKFKPVQLQTNQETTTN